MINAGSSAAAPWPLYVVAFRPGFVGLHATCIAVAFLTIVWS